MKKYRVEKNMCLSSGPVCLSKEQAEKRSNAVKKARKNGMYEVIAPVYFKVGEIIGFDELSKVNAISLSEVIEAKK